MTTFRAVSLRSLRTFLNPAGDGSFDIFRLTAPGIATQL